MRKASNVSWQNMSRLILLILISLISFSGTAVWAEQTASQSSAYVIQLDSAITPASANFVTKQLNKAQQQAKLAIIELDTPGGLANAMYTIVQAITNSSIPVITYVAPSGARATSAGAFILYASSVAAMAPGTNVGAASPIGLSGQSQPSKSSDETSTARKKATNDLSAYLQSLAEQHGRNTQIAQKMVTKAYSLTAENALRNNVIDIKAASIKELLAKADGRQVKVDGQPQKLNTHNLTLHRVSPDWRQQMLNLLASPQVVYVLLLLAFYGIIFEMMNPGLIFPGVIGLVAGILAIYGLQLLPVSIIGLSLLLAGMVFMVLELFVASMGLLAIAGLASFFLGSIFLFDPSLPGFHIPYAIAAAFTLVTGVFFLVIVRIAVRSQYRRVVSGNGVLIGARARVVGQRSDHYLVMVNGETWQAICDEPLEDNSEVQVVDRNGLWLTVNKIYQGD